ncbi:MAG TPA: primosomal protein N', partial [Planctomycetota bacterium]|nr:primosomal protein N' [Planctomycetota bacterium]
GRVVIQTFFPDHFAIRCAARNEFDEFARIELESRRALGYPPFGRLVKILLQGPDPEDVAREVESDAEVLRERREKCQILGPAPSPIAKIQGRFRYQILLKSSSSRTLHAALKRLEGKRPAPRRSVERIIDVDPQSML